MGQLSTEVANVTRKGFSGRTLDNPRNETCKMMEVEIDEKKQNDPLITDIKAIEALKKMVQEQSTLRVMLQTKKVAKNSCCNSLLEDIFSPIGKPLIDKMVVVARENRKKLKDEPPKIKEEPRCFSTPVTIKGFYVEEVMCDLGSSANMISLSLFNKIGELQLKPCKVRIGLVDCSLKNDEGVIETVGTKCV